MNDRLAKLDTARKALNLAGNARRLGDLALADAALQRAAELRAHEDGFTSPAEMAIALALYAYEEAQSRLNHRTFRANRTRQSIARHGALTAAERIVLNRYPSKGYEVLEEAGLEELSFEAIIVRFPNEFSAKALKAARARLEGRAPPAVAVEAAPAASGTSVSEPTGDVKIAALDAVALEFVSAFDDPPGWFLTNWLPRYRDTVAIVAQALARQRPVEVFTLIWKSADNCVSHAGPGLLAYESVDGLQDELTQVIRDIHADGSPASFRSIVQRFESWKGEGRIAKMPWLLIARAFAAIHPQQYHTTVYEDPHNQVLTWFSEHTGFVVPTEPDWATRALALTAHLDSLVVFGEDMLRRNIFPWFVSERLRSMPSSIPPGHSPRPLEAYSHLSPEERRVELRHNAIQTALFAQLVAEFGRKRVWTEFQLDGGRAADAIIRLPDDRCYLYEIKVAATASSVIRQAMGQLLEYGFREGGLEPVKLFVVGEPPLDAVSARFLERLRRDHGLDIGYLQITLEAEDEAVLDVS